MCTHDVGQMMYESLSASVGGRRGIDHLLAYAQDTAAVRDETPSLL